jgi:catechol 2,3-dioxygenase
MTTMIPRPTGSAALDYGIAPRGYRLPAATHLGRVVLQVADLERSLAYYLELIGLHVITRTPSAAVLGAHGDDTPLVELRERPGANPVPRRGRLGLYHYAILVPDRATLGRFLAHLSQRHEYAGMSDHLVSEALYLTDPDGLGIEVYADRPRSAWRSEGKQLVMTTEPLDVASVLAAADGVEWTGMPAGTRIGHVHLHVGDLAEAARFYHEGLGLDQVVWSYPGALFLSAGGYHHHLGTNVWAMGAAQAGEDDARLVEWEVVLPTSADVVATLDSLAAHGAVAERTGTSGLVRDPWGVGVRIHSAMT